jgi:threonine/homoserine/homoserine lactone efflux protein
VVLETNLILFLTASLALIVAPGPDNILVLTRGVAQGWGAALISAAGASVGLVIHSVSRRSGSRRCCSSPLRRTQWSSTRGLRT